MAHPNYIKMHIRTVPELLRDCAETMYQRVKNTLEDEKLEQTQMVVMTGCGYSYAAACNGAEFIEKNRRHPGKGALLSGCFPPPEFGCSAQRGADAFHRSERLRRGGPCCRRADALPDKRRVCCGVFGRYAIGNVLARHR